MKADVVNNIIKSEVRHRSGISIIDHPNITERHLNGSKLHLNRTGTGALANNFMTHIITHLAGQTYVWHGCKWNFAGPQIYLHPAKIKSQHFGVSLKFLVCN